MSVAIPELPSATGLVDACAEALALSMGLRDAPEPEKVEALRVTAHEVLGRVSARARKAGVDSKNIDEARYALCALIDETVLNSSWEKVKLDWISKPLQMELYGDFTAGEQFYTRLEALRGSRQREDVDVLEVYAQCLALGFRGKHADYAGMQKVAALLDEVCAEIRRSRGLADDRLSEAYERAEQLPEQIKQLPVWGVPAIGAVVLLLLLWILDGILAGQASDLLAELGSGGRS